MFGLPFLLGRRGGIAAAGAERAEIAPQQHHHEQCDRAKQHPLQPPPRSAKKLAERCEQLAEELEQLGQHLFEPARLGRFDFGDIDGGELDVAIIAQPLPCRRIEGEGCA